MGAFITHGSGIISKGLEYTVALSAYFNVFVKSRDSWQVGRESDYVEDEACDIVESLLKYMDRKEYDVYGTEDVIKTDGGYNIVVVVNFKIFVVDFDVDEAYNKAVDVVDDLELPDNVKITLIKQTKLVEVGEPVYMVVGE